MATTDDPNDPRLTHGVDAEPADQAAAYLVLSDEERARGFVRPVRRTYIHTQCEVARGIATTMSQEIAETYARDPQFYGATFCVGCRMHLPVDQFKWEDGSQLGS